MEDHDHDHQPKWTTMHPALGAHRWRGEVDYLGPLPAGKSDKDGDHWFDEHDNCPTTSNIDQADVDDNGIGDACPNDFFSFTLTADTSEVNVGGSSGLFASTGGATRGPVTFSATGLPPG